MRLSVVLLVVSLAGVLGGGWLIGRWAFGLCVIADSVVLGVLAVLFYDNGKPEVPPQAVTGPTLREVLERARRAG